MSKRYTPNNQAKALKREAEALRSDLQKTNDFNKQLQVELASTRHAEARAGARAYETEQAANRLSYGEVREDHSHGEKVISVNLRFDPRLDKDEMIHHAMLRVAEQMDRAWSKEMLKHHMGEDFNPGKVHRAEGNMRQTIEQARITWDNFMGEWTFRANGMRGNEGCCLRSHSLLELLSQFVRQFNK